ncbi:hypothetical protein CEXT_67851 [Caerostris extrusa]|uniref:Uncharacterized protein n=1 Tax=Caerostris extrusa TaxID=172846 RepID=A0AAV4N948_CAEEX|nr:hypothetical protein CEXT_67851 [Caerostris extrusa]
MPSYLANATSCRIYIAPPDDDVGILQWVLCFCSAINPDSKTKKVEMSRWLLSSPELNSEILHDVYGEGKIPSCLANAKSCRIYIAAPDDDVGILQWVLCFCSAINPDSKTKKVEMSMASVLSRVKQCRQMVQPF